MAVTSSEIVSTLIAIGLILEGGRLVTMALGWPFGPDSKDTFQRPFHTIVQTLIDILSRRIWHRNWSLRTSSYALLLSYAAVVTLLAILAEVLFLGLAATVVLLIHHIGGIAINATPILRGIVASIVVLTAAMVFYGNQEISRLVRMV